MILSIYCSELRVNDDVPKEHADKSGYVFVNGATVNTHAGYELFSVSGSDEYGCTINSVESYKIEKGYVTATLMEPLI